MKQFLMRAFLTGALALGSVSVLAAANEAPDLNLIQTGEHIWFYAAANDDASKEPVFMSISRPVGNGPVSLAFGGSLDALSVAASYYIDAQGRLEASTGIDNTGISCSYAPDRVSVNARTKAGERHKDILTQRPVLDFGALMLFAGAFSLEKPGEERPFKALVSTEKNLADYDVYVKLKSEDSLEIAGSRYQSQELEVGASGLLGLAVPKMLVWIDTVSRLPLRIKSGDKLIFELVRVGP
jgi:hypothetical protein